MFNGIYTSISKWFFNSETILLARVQMFLGALMGVAASFDFSPLLGNTVPTKQQMILSAILFMQGLATEVARRRKTIADDLGNLQSVAPPPKVGG